MTNELFEKVSDLQYRITGLDNIIKDYWARIHDIEKHPQEAQAKLWYRDIGIDKDIKEKANCRIAEMVVGLFKDKIAELESRRLELLNEFNQL